jgi:hypothetical protein
MRHILLYENFRDPLRGARDLFGLTSSFTKRINPSSDRIIEFTGPVESEGEARKIADQVLKAGGDLQAALAPIGWQAKEVQSGFGSWGDPINKTGPQFILMQKNHYLTQEREIGQYSNLQEAIPDFLDWFKIEMEEYGTPKKYFSEWNPEVEDINSWDEFFSRSPGIDETTFYLEDFDPARGARIYSEVDLLEIVHRRDPSYLEGFLHFS